MAEPDVVAAADRAHLQLYVGVLGAAKESRPTSGSATIGGHDVCVDRSGHRMGGESSACEHRGCQCQAESDPAHPAPVHEDGSDDQWTDRLLQRHRCLEQPEVAPTQMMRRKLYRQVPFPGCVL